MDLIIVDRARQSVRQSLRRKPSRAPPVKSRGEHGVIPVALAPIPSSETSELLGEISGDVEQGLPPKSSVPSKTNGNGRKVGDEGHKSSHTSAAFQKSPQRPEDFTTSFPTRFDHDR